MYRINKDSILDVSEEGVIIQIDDEFYGVNTMAYEIINLIIETQSIGDTVLSLSKTYDIDLDMMEDDVREILADCMEKGIITLNL